MGYTVLSVISTALCILWQISLKCCKYNRCLYVINGDIRAVMVLTHGAHMSEDATAFNMGE